MKQKNSNNSNIKNNKLVNKQRRKRRIFLSYFSILSLVSLIGIIFTIAIIFKIDKIEVEGSSIYDLNEVIVKSKIKKGENLLFCQAKGIKSEIERSLPYIDEVDVIKKIPNKVVLSLKESSKAGIIEVDGKYAIINNRGKILEVVDQVDSDLMFIKGLKIKNALPGFYMEYEDTVSQDIFSELTNAIRDKKIQGIKMLDVSDSSKIIMNYQDRININLGFPEKILYKIKTASEILNNKIKDGEKGNLDLSLLLDNNRSYFSPA